MLFLCNVGVNALALLCGKRAEELLFEMPVTLESVEMENREEEDWEAEGGNDSVAPDASEGFANALLEVLEVNRDGAAEAREAPF